MLHIYQMEDLQQAETSPGWGGEGEVSNMTGYRLADSWGVGKEVNMP
jgi:hypothetical protein